MNIAIVTPTYNRAKTLVKLYESLIRNKKTYDKFTWYVMDDGSTDDTSLLINEYIKENVINIKYYYQDNKGKMMALNNVMVNVVDDIIIEVDSDDYLYDDLLINVINKWDYIKDNDKIYGLLFRRVSETGQVMGGKFKDGITTTMFDLYFKTEFDGETCIIFKGDIRRKYLHELYDGEKFVTEAYMYNKMDLDYDGLQCYNINGVVCEYLEGGYTKNINKLFKQNPHGYYNYFSNLLLFKMKGVLIKKRLYIIKHYILFSYLTKKTKLKTINNVHNILNKVLVILLIIPGYIKAKRLFN